MRACRLAVRIGMVVRGKVALGGIPIVRVHSAAVDVFVEEDTV